MQPFCEQPFTINYALFISTIIIDINFIDACFSWRKALIIGVTNFQTDVNGGGQTEWAILSFLLILSKIGLDSTSGFCWTLFYGILLYFLF